MNKLKISLFYVALGSAVFCAAFGSIGAQTKVPANEKKSPDWLRNNAPIPVSDEYPYNEDSYYGIERFGVKVPKSDVGSLEKIYRSQDGTGSGTGEGSGGGVGTGPRGGNGIGSGNSDNNLPEAASWVPYYNRPSNCATADYQPTASGNLPAADERLATRTAQIVDQPRPLYSRNDYLAGREGTIKLQILLKANGTVGSVRPLTRLPGDMTQSAMRAACYVTFHPAMKNGRAADSVKIVSYSFTTDQVNRTANYPIPPSPTASLNILSRPRAVYTPEARQKLIQGTVTLRVTFLASGRIGKITPVSGLPDGLTEQAIEAARGIRFEPARVKGRSYTQTKTIQYNFTVY